MLNEWLIYWNSKFPNVLIRYSVYIRCFIYFYSLDCYLGITSTCYENHNDKKYLSIHVPIPFDSLHRSSGDRLFKDKQFNSNFLKFA